MIAVLDNIRSNHNVGSIFRTADGAGIEKIYLCGITPSPTDRFGRENKAFTKVSLGAENNIKYEKIKSIENLLDNLKSEGYKIIAIEQHEKAKSIFDFKLKNSKVAIIIGQEVGGLSKEILDKSDEILEIPMRGKKESLNVSVAFGIAVYQLSK